jgi:4-amino-4-deoxy-L-arabinose transferase-like glycosyltransferase
MGWLNERNRALIVAVVCVAIYVPFAGCYGMWDPWETHFGEVARQMAVRNDFITLWYPCSNLENEHFYTKPVLLFWLMALSLKAFGLATALPGELARGWRAEWACRLPVVALGLTGIATLYFTVRRLVNARAALFAAIVLATSTQWLLVSRQAMTDMPFVVPMTIALCLAALALLPSTSTSTSRAFYAFVTLFTLSALPQLIAFSIQLRPIFIHRFSLPGFIAMLPYFAGFFFALWWCARAKTQRELYLFSAYTLCGLANLAKGPAGLAMPALVLLVYLVCAGRWREIFTKLELPRGLLLFTVVGVPWFHAMLIRHGMPFWNEFIGDNYLNRATGRHGDRGTFEYYIEWASYALFPWTGIVAVGLLAAFRKRSRLAQFCLAWIVVDFFIITLVRTKFHHYLLPIVPPLAILGGLWLDDFCARRDATQRFALAVIALPLTLLCGFDLAAFPARIFWLFNYDYVNMPGVGRPWPAIATYGQTFEYGRTLYAIVALAAACVVGMMVRRRFVVLFGALAVAWSFFIVDKLLIELSPHWSQKRVIAAYYDQRRGPEEPLIAWSLFWHGENFYTQNEIYSSADPLQRTVFLGDHSNDRLQTYLTTHAHRRVFFVVERVHLEALRGLLPPASKPTLRIVDDSNNKLYLATADI